VEREGGRGSCRRHRVRRPPLITQVRPELLDRQHRAPVIAQHRPRLLAGIEAPPPPAVTAWRSRSVVDTANLEASTTQNRDLHRQVVDVLYAPLKTSDNAVEYHAVRDLPGCGCGDVREAVGDVVAVAGPQAGLLATANDGDAVPVPFHLVAGPAGQRVRFGDLLDRARESDLDRTGEFGRYPALSSPLRRGSSLLRCRQRRHRPNGGHTTSRMPFTGSEWSRCGQNRWCSGAFAPSHFPHCHAPATPPACVQGSAHVTVRRPVRRRPATRVARTSRPNTASPPPAVRRARSTPSGKLDFGFGTAHTLAGLWCG
jgi:hypothetical protein